MPLRAFQNLGIHIYEFCSGFPVREFSIVLLASLICKLLDIGSGGQEVARQAGLNNIGITLGLALENFDFGVHYNFRLEILELFILPVCLNCL